MIMVVHNRDQENITCHLLSSDGSPRSTLVSVHPWPRVVCVVVILMQKKYDDDDYNDIGDDDNTCLGPVIRFRPR